MIPSTGSMNYSLASLLNGRSRYPDNLPWVGAPHFSPTRNTFTPGATLPALSHSYLSQVLSPQEPGTQKFGLGDHVSVPVSQLEAQLTSPVTSTASGLLDRARTLQAAANALVAGTPAGVFERRTATSSDPAIAAQASDGATRTNYAVDVSQIALAQQNVGAQLVAAQTPSDLSPGVYTFAVSTASGSTNVSFSVSAGDTNAQVLASVQTALNVANAGVEATVVGNRDVSQLVVTASQTGTSNQFTLSDVAGTAVAALGVGTATSPATDALVRVNGVDQTLQQNRLDLDVPDGGGPPRLSLFLRGTTQTTANVDVTVSLNAAQVANGTQRLVDAVNTFRAFMADKPGILTRGLLDQLDVAVNTLRQTLASVGITADSAGALTLDRSGLQSALDTTPDAVVQAIGAPGNFASRQSAVAQTVLSRTNLVFAGRPGPLGTEYARFLTEASRAHNYLYGGLFVNFLA